MIEVIAIYNRIPEQGYYNLQEFHKSLRKFGYEAKVLGLSEPWGGLMTKPKKLKAYLASGRCKADYVIFVDAWDVVFAKSPDEIIERYKTFGSALVIGSEINCFPAAGMACDFPPTDSPFKYLNSGCIVGTPQAILAMLESMKPDAIPDDYQISEESRWEPNDQWYVQLEFHKQPVSMRLDYEAQIVLNCCNVDEEMMRKYDPCIYHFNGGSKQSNVKDIVFAILGY